MTPASSRPPVIPRRSFVISAGQGNDDKFFVHQSYVQLLHGVVCFALLIGGTRLVSQLAVSPEPSDKLCQGEGRGVLEFLEGLRTFRSLRHPVSHRLHVHFKKRNTVEILYTRSLDQQRAYWSGVGGWGASFPISEREPQPSLTLLL